MYISEHVVHIRQQRTTVGRAHKSTFFFLFFSTTTTCVLARAHARRVHIQNNAQRVKRRSSPSVRSFIRIVVLNGYCRLLPPKFDLLCLHFFHHHVSKKLSKIHLEIYFPLHGELFLDWICMLYNARLVFLLFIEKSSLIRMIVLFSLCGFCKFMTRSHTHPN
jgi:hypothetical protein